MYGRRGYRVTADGTSFLGQRHGWAIAALIFWCAWAFPAQWKTPPEYLHRVDLRNPRVSGPADVMLLQRAVEDCRQAVTLMRAGGAARIPDDFRGWALRQIAWWTTLGEWFYGDAPMHYAAGVVCCGGLARGAAKQLIVKAAEDVRRYLSQSFGLPSPRYALFVRLFDDYTTLPVAVAQEFAQHRGLSSVSGLTLPPRFIVIPTVLPARHFWSPDEQLVGKDGRILSLLTFRDIVYHEMVHGLVMSIIDEARGERGLARLSDFPSWLHEGLAVYVTEKLRIEPGTKPAEYYRWAGPLHYLEDEWGEGTLQDFVRTAIVDSYPRALDIIPMDEARLLELGEQHMRRPPSVRSVVRALGYFLGFLGALLLLALTPAAVGWAWQIARR
ncbi:MAG: hypothetical protein H5T86_06055, partial [Armatimonadetes bacterium]|nr:hypothetical protein [Armatimonadota bacterium]